MIDFHSHILHRVDDGSKSKEESLSLVSMLQKQGVDRIIATPHFYANSDTVESFLERRNASYNELKAFLPQNSPEILLGAEVRYYTGVSRLTALDSLCIQNSKLLLLEMPFSAWTEYTVKEVLSMSAWGDITIVLAHIERYLSMQKTDVLSDFLQNGILLQMNAEAFTRVLSRRRALKLLQNRAVSLIGSDCHGVSYRPPLMDKAFEYIEKKLGSDFITEMSEYQATLFGD